MPINPGEQHSKPLLKAVAVAQANVDLALAARDSQRRLVATQQSGARQAQAQTRRAETNLALATRTEQRLAPLSAKGYVPEQQLDQAQVAARDASTSLRQAREQEQAAHQSVGSDAGTEAGVRAATAALENARRALLDTEVRASQDGRVSEGMVRAYLVGDRVAGFGHQAINALHPDHAQPGPRLYHGPDFALCKDLRQRLESDWIAQLRECVGLSAEHMPLLWDCDFMLGQAEAGEPERYVLCEINVSSVSPFPPSCIAPIVDAVRCRLNVG